MSKGFSIAGISEQRPTRKRAASAERELQRYARRLQSEANESPTALQGGRKDPSAKGTARQFRDQQAPRIVRPGDPNEYRDGALVGWLPLRRAT